MSRPLRTCKDGRISASSSWTSRSEKYHVADVIFTYQPLSQNKQADGAALNESRPLYLERAEDDTPCVIALQCTQNPPAAIHRLLVVSEARTMEAYSQSGEYCGTSRGEKDPGVPNEGNDERGPFYRKLIELESPSTSCELKLLSLGGRTGIAVSHIEVGLRLLEAGDGGQRADPSIDLQRVQNMMEKMGTSLSPGAQSLMDMVQFQQKNRSDVLAGGFLPLLLGSGGLTGLAKMELVSAPTEHSEPTERAVSDTASTESQAPDPRPPPQAAHSPPPPTAASGISRGALKDLMSSFLGAQPGQHCSVGPEVFPLLQSVCGQVAQLRMEDSTTAEVKGHLHNGPRDGHVCCRDLVQMVEKQMEGMERRLKEHMDQRLDALQHKIEVLLQQTSPQT
ncbi:ATPase PAAT [Denticeps clupeoides]|uniref:Uncharacterized protein n=1 Tax=Denticeps clupeoides TaxID=299321 RepID=A0AAY4DQB9_9TELE|nr:uncharacterized protein C10orf88 homolog [Denticeps clupeoides]